MNSTFESPENRTEFDLYQEIESLIKTNPRGWQSVCAVVGLACGSIAPLLGATSDVMTWFVHSLPANSYLHLLSIVLFALTIPLLILSAYCLDSLEAKTTRLSPIASTVQAGATPATAVRRIAQQNAADRLHRTGALTVLLFLLALPATARAQQTVFNVPTTDVLERGRVYFELDISARPNKPKIRTRPS